MLVSKGYPDSSFQESCCRIRDGSINRGKNGNNYRIVHGVVLQPCDGSGRGSVCCCRSAGYHAGNRGDACDAVAVRNELLPLLGVHDLRLPGTAPVPGSFSGERERT